MHYRNAVPSRRPIAPSAAFRRMKVALAAAEAGTAAEAEAEVAADTQNSRVDAEVEAE